MNLDAVGGENFDRPIHPAEIELSFCRLKRRPCAFTGLDEIDAGRLHHLGIFLPHGFRPMVRIVISSVDEICRRSE